VPSATDACVKNLMVVDRHVPVPIDLGHLRLDPFYYPVGFVGQARSETSSAFLEGRLNAELAELFAAAGATWPLDRRGLEALLASRVVVSSSREARRRAERRSGTPSSRLP
jgi:hypothetical protein